MRSLWVLLSLSAVGQPAYAAPEQAHYPASVAAPELRKWTLNDSLGLTYLTDARGGGGWVASAHQSQVSFSPDRRYVFFMSRTPVPAKDINLDQMFVYSTANLAREIERGTVVTKPLAHVAFESASSGPGGIAQPIWFEDGIVFLGEAKSIKQVFTLSLPSGVLKQLTSSPLPVTLIQFTPESLRKGSFVYSTATDTPGRRVLPYPYYPVKKDSNGNISETFPLTHRDNDYSARTFLHSAMRGDVGLGNANRFWFSSDGALAVFLSDLGKGLGANPAYVILDMNTGISRKISIPLGLDPDVQVTAVMNFSAFLHSDVIWEPRSHHVFLANAQVPSAANGKDGFILDYELSTGSWQIVCPMTIYGADHQVQEYVTSIDHNSTPGELLVTSYDGSDYVTRRYHRDVTGWKNVGQAAISSTSPTFRAPMKASATVASDGGLSVEVQQSANDPPLIVARRGGREIILRDRDPIVKSVRYLRQERFDWSDPDGTAGVGALVLPAEGRSGGPYPLVIQVERHLTADTLNYFLPDGAASVGFLAEPLAAAGIAVLRISGIEAESEGNSHELEKVGSRLDAVVAKLAAEGLIDPARVGIIGHSRAGFHVFETITNPRKVQFAAAVAVDGITGTFWQYLTDRPNRDLERVHGGSFWEKKGAWLNSEPTFNVDRVRTPAMFIQHGSEIDSYSINAADVIGAFEYNRKPIEYLFFPKGSHDLHRPAERRAENQAVFDWLRFWLQDIVPEDKDEAKRWAVLKDRQAKVLASPLPPRGNWTFVPEQSQK